MLHRCKLLAIRERSLPAEFWKFWFHDARKLPIITCFRCKVRNIVRQFPANCCCLRRDPRLLASQFSRLFWGEQPPFASIGRGGRYFFNDEFRMSNDKG